MFPHLLLLPGLNLRSWLFLHQLPRKSIVGSTSNGTLDNQDTTELPWNMILNSELCLFWGRALHDSLLILDFHI